MPYGYGLPDMTAVRGSWKETNGGPASATGLGNGTGGSGGTLAMTTNDGRTFIWDLAAMRRELGQLGLDWP